MRNLTITRTKSFVGCLGKIKVYIEDALHSELYINDVPCRKLGDLKNGEQKTFAVENESLKVFVIADKLSKNFCNEYYQLPAGNEDIALSGKNRYNPAVGNPFRFDNNENPDAIANRKRGRGIGFGILIVAIIVGFLLGYFLTNEQEPMPEVFSSGGMSIVLTDEFAETPVDKYTATYDSRDVAVIALKEEFSLFEGFENYTLEQYANLVIENNNMSDTDIKNVNGLMSFEYTYFNPETNKNYIYFSYVYKSGDAFWLVQVATEEDKATEYFDDIVMWANSVEFEG